MGEGTSTEPTKDTVFRILAGGGSAITNNDNVASVEGCDAIMTAAVEAFDRLDGVIHNARLGNLLSYRVGAVLTALRDEPSAVTGTPLTAGRLARGLESVLASFGQVLEYAPDYRWSVEAEETDVVVILTGTIASGGDSVALREVDGSAFRTPLPIPLAANRAELGLLYAAFHGQSVTWVPSGSHELVPGELADWHFTCQHLDKALGRLVDGGLLQWTRTKGRSSSTLAPESALCGLTAWR
jgi:hypothetical protein